MQQNIIAFGFDRGDIRHEDKEELSLGLDCDSRQLPANQGCEWIQSISRGSARRGSAAAICLQEVSSALSRGKFKPSPVVRHDRTEALD
jgi:hypothetical protein